MPPLRNAAATRERLLTCARKRFLNESYENVGLRDVAADAGVDVALVGRYFGSKEQLFQHVLRKEDGGWKALAASATDLPALIAEFATCTDAAGEAGHIERLLIMLRSASSPQASALVRASFEQEVLTPLSKLLSGEDAQTRAAMAMSVLMGTAVVRTIMNLNALQQCDAGAFRDRLEALLRVALD